MSRPIIIGICGGTGSGKSTVADEIFSTLPEKNIVVIQQDSYYKDLAHLPMIDRTTRNFDHPLAFDNELLKEHIRSLMDGKAIEKPVYDFTVHSRSHEVEVVQPRDIIIIEGIMILEDQELRDLMDIKIFVDTDPDVRILRRIRRDIKERGRTLDSVIEQYLTTVKPAHEQFVEPTKKFADLIIPEGGRNKVAIDIMASKIASIIREKE